jgi:hypothetical protein
LPAPANGQHLQGSQLWRLSESLATAASRRSQP